VDTDLILPFTGEKDFIEMDIPIPLTLIHVFPPQYEEVALRLERLGDKLFYHSGRCTTQDIQARAPVEMMRWLGVYGGPFGNGNKLFDLHR
jgi:hypothetical protein